MSKSTDASKKSAPPKGKKNVPKPVVIKQCMGLDVSKDSVNICFMELLSDQNIKLRQQRAVPNTKKGWEIIIASIKSRLKETQLGFMAVMEATGVYHENMCYALYDAGIRVSVVLSNVANKYAGSLNSKSKNDKIDAQLLSRMGLERLLEEWAPMSKNALTIKNLTRERKMLMEEKTSVSNQYHAASTAHELDSKSKKRYEKRLEFLSKQILETETQLMNLAKSDSEFNEYVELLVSIKGIGKLTAVVVLSELDCFKKFSNESQVISFVGYDVVQNQSGNTTGKTRISKKGNSHVRAALYFPSITAARTNPMFQSFYARVYETSKVKAKAFVAVQAKLLRLMYALCKNKTFFDSEYLEKKEKERQEKEKNRAGVALEYA